MTKNRQILHRLNTSSRSPGRHNSSLRKKALVKRISGEVQFGAASKANLKVVVRVRPQNEREEEKGARCVVDVLDEHMLVFDPKENAGDGFFFKGRKQQGRDLCKRQPLEKKFVFEHVFGGEATNTDLYQATAHPLVDTLLKGYNCSVFAYGATGAGKTFTMLGRPECPGITSLTLQELYQRLDELKGERRCEVAVSYLEVYNETVRDLLGTGKPLALQEMAQQVMVPGLSLHKPSSAKELLEMLAQGNSNRTQHATDANAESSRSHAVFQIFVRQQDLDASAKAAVTISKLSMIDLAGSERGSATGHRGVRFKEGSSINKSLLALGNCINALADGKRHIPYRDSKLTRLLKDSLGGNCRSVMIAAMSPAFTSFEETYNTLRYAERAKTIRTTIRNNVKNVDQHVSDYIKVVQGLKEEVAGLREKLKEYQKKEEEWENQKGAAAAAAPATPQPSASAQEEEEEEKQKEDEISEEEAEAQRQLQDASAEQKALRQELLQLEAAHRATELKRQHWMARLARVQVIAFASSKLDKTLKRCERTIHTLDARLSQTAQCIEAVKRKVAASLAKMHAAQEALCCFGPEPDLLSKHSQGLVERHDASIALRDSHLLGEHLHTLLQEDFKENHASEQLVHLLLGGVRDLYLQLYEKEQCCPKVRGIFQHVVDGLDECRIAWADQQDQAEGEGGQAASGDQPVASPLDVDHFARLPSLTATVISPTVVVEPVASFRKSSMMVNVNTAVPPHHHHHHHHHHQPAGEARMPPPPTTTTTTTSTSTASESRQPSLTATATTAASQQPQGTDEDHTITPVSPVLSYQIAQTLGNREGRSQAFSSAAAADSQPQQHRPPSTTTSTVATNTPAKSLNVTYDNIPSASKLSSISITTTASSRSLASHSSAAARLPHITMPSPSPLPLTTINTTTTTTRPNTMAASLSASSFTTLTIPTRALNTTIDLHSPLFLSTTATSTTTTTTTTTITGRLSDNQLLQRASCTSQPCPSDTHHAAAAPQEPVQPSAVVLASSSSSSSSSTTTTTTTAATSGPAVARKLFPEDRAGFNSTFSIDQSPAEDPTTSPQPPSEPAREAPGRSSGSASFKSATSRSPLVPVTHRASHSNLLSIPENPSSKPSLVKSLRGLTGKRMLSRTPHKAVVLPLSTGKTAKRELGMRRSVSTPSLVSQPPSIRHPPSTTKRKPTGLSGALHRSSSILRGRATNQENVPPGNTRRPTASTPWPAASPRLPRSPGPCGKA